MYEEFITQLHMHAKAIRILSKGYLPISVISPSKLKEILHAVKEAIQTTNPDYDIVIKRLHLYYDMKSVTLAQTEIEFNSPIFRFCSAIYATTADIMSNRNSPSSYYRSK